jgi:hypothetical protein
MRAEDKPEKPGTPEDRAEKDRAAARAKAERRRAERTMLREERKVARGTVEGGVGEVEVVTTAVVIEGGGGRPDPITRPERDARRDRITVVLPRERLEEFAEVLIRKYPARRSTDVLAEWLVERLDAEMGS